MIEFGLYHSISDCDEGYIIEDSNLPMTRRIFCDECVGVHEFVLGEHFYNIEDLWAFLAEMDDFD